ncbi:hypothetical protein O181_037446 [Austropuccinia psidii MF-1]|uniref:F-box domain-containing protein n=1 Tax=Austropuccinia psidii MF-1 TaxID=1389203 RepID=A0A9Q3D675_9BASI|nr:hypothetical protein [Austropuccinia psidii MF-1]
MAKLLDLPQEVLEIIFDYLIRSDCQDIEGMGSKDKVRISVLTNLRLHPERINRLNCRKLLISDLWYGGRENQKVPSRMLSSFTMLDMLLELFSDTVTELELELVHCLGFPRRTVEIVGQVKNLQVLRIGLKPLWFTDDSSNMQSADRCHNHDSESLRSLLMATQQLVCLDLSELPLNLLPTFGRRFYLNPALRISRIDIKIEPDETPLQQLIDLCIGLKSSLKVLSIQSVIYDGRRLLPLFELLKDTLEGLFISHNCTLTHILDFNFPRLRVFRVNYWNKCIGQFLNRKMFTEAPLQVLALYSHTVSRRRIFFWGDPFVNLRSLKKLVFLHARLDEKPPVAYLKACQAHQVQCVYLSHSKTSEIMKL